MLCTFLLYHGVPQGSIVGPPLFNLAVGRVARHLEQNTSARFTLYTNYHYLVRVEGLPQPDSHAGRITTAHSFETMLPNFGRALALAKTELLSLFGFESPATYNTPSITTTGTITNATLNPIRLLGIPIGHKNNPQVWLQKHKQKC